MDLCHHVHFRVDEGCSILPVSRHIPDQFLRGVRSSFGPPKIVFLKIARISYWWLVGIREHNPYILILGSLLPY